MGRTSQRTYPARWKSTAVCVLVGLTLGMRDSPRPVRADAQEASGQVVFQPAFHQALRWSYSTPRATYRLKVPLGRGGDRIRVSFRAGDGPLLLHAATIARAGAAGALASGPVALTFGGSPSFTASPRQRFTSDPVDFPATFGEEVAVSFEVEGELAASAIDAFPGSQASAGGHAADPGPLDGVDFTRAVGLDTIDVEGPPGRAFVALGDSITEGYVSGADDYRQSWPFVAQGLLAQPFVNAAVSGEGIYEERVNLQAEVLTLQGITDCVVLLGTNDLAALDTPELSSRLGGLFDQLRPFCRVWAGTLLPKERDGSGDLALVNGRRQALNAWIRTQASVAGVIDFEAALRRPDDPDRFQEGLGYDGIHPSVAGQHRMGEEAARVLSGGAPPEAQPTGGTSSPVASAPPVPGDGVAVGGGGDGAAQASQGCAAAPSSCELLLGAAALGLLRRRARAASRGGRRR